MAAMLSRLGGRGYGVKEEPAVYGPEGIDFDPDSDFDLDDNESQEEIPLDRRPLGRPSKSDLGRFLILDASVLLSVIFLFFWKVFILPHS
jgi:hypothetical protein